MPFEPSTTPNAILLTGCTGFLGQYVLRDLLLDQKDVVVIARGKRRKTAVDRVKSIVNRWETLLSTKLALPTVIDWDIQSRPDSLSASDRKLLSDRVGTIVHTAASVRFTLDESTNEPYTSNVEGTRNLLALAQRIGKCDFHHVSTAYVSGFSNDTVTETLPRNPQFRNVYEESKYRAECLLFENRDCFQSLTFYRPSIIVGDSRSGFAPSFHTIYLALRLASLIQNTDGYSLSRLLNSMGVSPSISKNLVPVDWVSSAIITLLKSPSSRNNVYHLTNAFPQSLEEIIDAMLDAISLETDHWKKICGASGSVDATELTDVFMHSFREYFQDDPQFDTTNLQSECQGNLAPRMSKEVLTRLFRYAIRVGFTEAESQSADAIKNKAFCEESPLLDDNSISVYCHSRKSQQFYSRRIDGPLALEILRCVPNVPGPFCVFVADEALLALEKRQLSCKEALQESAMVIMPASSAYGKTLMPLDFRNGTVSMSSEFRQEGNKDGKSTLQILREAQETGSTAARTPLTREQSS
jgi:thioester reductase-like protein